MLHDHRNRNSSSKSVRISESDRSVIQYTRSYSPLISIVFGSVKEIVSILIGCNSRSDQRSSRVSPSLIKVYSLSRWYILDEVIRKVSIEIFLIEESVDVEIENALDIRSDKVRSIPAADLSSSLRHSISLSEVPLIWTRGEY